MARRFNRPDVIGETMVRRVMRVGTVETWLILDTTLSENSSGLAHLLTSAHDFISKNEQFTGVDIRMPIA